MKHRTPKLPPETDAYLDQLILDFGRDVYAFRLVKQRVLDRIRKTKCPRR